MAGLGGDLVTVMNAAKGRMAAIVPWRPMSLRVVTICLPTSHCSLLSLHQQATHDATQGSMLGIYTLLDGCATTRVTLLSLPHTTTNTPTQIRQPFRQASKKTFSKKPEEHAETSQSQDSYPLARQSCYSSPTVINHPDRRTHTAIITII